VQNCANPTPGKPATVKFTVDADAVITNNAVEPDIFQIKKQYISAHLEKLAGEQ